MNIQAILQEPLVLLFIILFIGSLAGEAKIKGISLGMSAVLFTAMIFGHFGYEVSGVVQNLGLSLFIVAVGLQAGPRFFRMMRTSGVIYGIIGLLTILTAAATTLVMARLFDLSPALSIGIMSGALTSTPGLAAALEATGDPLASVGYGIAYPFGVLAVVLFVQLLPKVLKVDLMRDLQRKTGPLRHQKSPEVMTIEVTSDKAHKRTLKELEVGKGTSAVISRVIRGDRNIISLSDTVILKGDKLVTVGLPADLKSIREQLGREVNLAFENHDHVKLRKVTVAATDMVGKSLRELALRRTYGVTVTRIERGGFEFNQHPGWRLEQGDILTVVSSEERIDEVEKLFSKRKLETTNVHIFSLSLILLLGILLGMIPISIPGLGTITLGVAGGPLFAALIIGHFGRLGPIRARFFQPSNQIIRDIGLVLFLAGAGTTAGAGLADVIAEEGLKLLAAGAVITIVPLLLGFLVAVKLFHLSMLHSLGALCGGMTSTPGLGALNQIVDSEDPSIAYAAAYPFALISVALVSQVLVLFL
ncbi:aspartate:alanine exchanger family transporter [Alkalicoccus daliensis]|uniref:Putative transport protein n=1 Tax=Alkalicoccus daliensis TaxID=745820 RepID=A0A1H0HKM6_9BACI|nr:TrkA C-terminal domain-containing protein [Alkalicoccus daliensis]SDO19391.1 putative transport protein [Alkalicoccus daliensis]